MRLSKVCVIGAAILALGLLQATRAEAATFTVDFCTVNATQCTDGGLDHAILSFEEILGPPDTDPNDYILTVTLDGDPLATETVEAFSFAIGGVDNITGAGGYEAVPTVTADPAGATGDPWLVFYDGINQGSDCTNTGQSTEVCVEGTGTTGLPLNGGNLVWMLNVNIFDTGVVISNTTPLQLRIRFDQGVFSPGFSNGSTGTGGGGGTGETVPEPASLTLFGLAALGAAYRIRRTRTN
jgi:hypothetical protein